VLTLDLHGIKHAEVPRQIDTFIWQAMQRDDTHVEIITGHSDEMKSIAQETLKDYNMTCEIAMLNSGCMVVKLR